MNTLSRSLLFIATVPLIGSAAVVFAQSAPAPSGAAVVPSQSPLPAAPPPAANSQPASAAPGASAGANQPQTAVAPASMDAMISAGLPKYEPPKPPPPKPADPQADQQNVDKPQNGIVRLPNYYVRTAREAVLRDPDLVSQKGMADIGFKDNPGLKLFPFTWLDWLNQLNAGTAKEMYLEDQRLQKISDLNETADAIGRGGDASMSESIKSLTQDTYMQPVQFGGLFPDKF